MSNNITSSDNLPVLFDYKNIKIPTLEIEGEICCEAKAVCKAAGVKNVSQAVGRLAPDCKYTICTTDNNVPTKHLYVTLPGLFDLILSGRKEEAIALRYWVTHTVLPEIYRTGGYNLPNTLQLLDKESVDTLVSDINHNLQNFCPPGQDYYVPNDLAYVDTENLQGLDKLFAYLRAHKIYTTISIQLHTVYVHDKWLRDFKGHIIEAKEDFKQIMREKRK